MPAKKLHTKIVDAIHTKSTNDMLTAFAEPSDELLGRLADTPGIGSCEDPVGVMATEIRSLIGEGALELLLQTPFKPSLAVVENNGIFQKGLDEITSQVG